MSHMCDNTMFAMNSDKAKVIEIVACKTDV